MMEYRVIATSAEACGPGYIAGGGEGDPPGLVTVVDAPAAREVEVRLRRSRRVIATTFSAADGTYRIDNIRPGVECDVIGRDFARQWQDVIVGAVTSKPYADE